MRRSSENIQVGLNHLKSVDPILGGLIDKVGPCRIQLESDRFRALVRSIISQQISGQAAQSIFRKLVARFPDDELTPKGLADTPLDNLRSAGVSPQKAAYLLDLARKITDGQVRLNRLGRLADDGVIRELVQVKGIGVWTAQMFLIFSLGRMNVFPAEDLGVRVALRNIYGLSTMPDRATSERIAAPWRPFATLGSWYCWRSLELQERDR